MAKEEKFNRGGRSALQRSDVVTVRLNPHLNYYAELAARRQRRTKSSYIEWCIKTALEREFEAIDPEDQHDQWHALWSPFESDRFVKLAFRQPDLLNFEEEIRWQLIRENGLFWSGWYSTRIGVYQWPRTEENINLPRLREHYEVFCQVSRGELPDADLPKWPRTRAEIADFPELRHEYEAAPDREGFFLFD